MGVRELVGWRMRSSGLIVLYFSQPVDADGGGSGSNFSQSEEGIRRILHVRTPNFSHECPSWGHLTGMDIGYEGTERGVGSGCFDHWKKRQSHGQVDEFTACFQWQVVTRAICFNNLGGG